MYPLLVYLTPELVSKTPNQCSGSYFKWIAHKPIRRSSFYVGWWKACLYAIIPSCHVQTSGSCRSIGFLNKLCWHKSGTIWQESETDESDEEHEETEEEFLERYAETARELQEEAIEEAENGQDEDGHEIELGIWSNGFLLYSYLYSVLSLSDCFMTYQ